MPIEEPSPNTRLLSFTRVLIGLVALAVVLAAGGFTFAASQETRDSFCASCHTQPESTFVARSTAADPVDLAAYHTTQSVRCIDCHAGRGLMGRMQAELLGARNTAAWYTHTAVQPAQVTHPIGDPNCLKCHQDVVRRGYTPKHPVTIFREGRGGEEEEGGPNHWHELLARWQASSPAAATCTSCHPGHSTDGTAETGFENVQATRSACEGCHRMLGEGEREGRRG